MRNIADYEQQYMEHPFERTQEGYRRKQIKSMIDTYAKAGNAILEIGCGLSPLFADYQDEYLFTVVEPAKHCYQNACSLAESYQNVKCFQGFFEEVVYQLGEKPFDMIICSSLLHEVEQPQLLLRAIGCLCHSQTIVHINVPNAFSFHRLLAKEMGFIQDVHQLSDANKTLQQYHVFDMETLTQLAVSEGFAVVDAGTYFLKPFTHQQMQQCLDAGILNHDILNALDQMCTSYMKEYGSEIYLNMHKICK